MASPPCGYNSSPATEVDAVDRIVSGTRYSPATPEAAALYAAAGLTAGHYAGAPSPFGAAVADGRRNFTLAEVRRKAIEDRRDIAHLRRYRHLNYSSDDSALHLTEKKLSTLYCSVCGAHALITENDFSSSPKRNSDEASVLQVTEYFSKLYTVPGERTLIRRPAGLEVQYRIKCRDCGFPLGYKAVPHSESPQLVYFFKDALCLEQHDSAAHQHQSKILQAKC